MLLPLYLGAIIGASSAFASPSYDLSDNCPGQEIMVTETLKIGDHALNMTLPACPGFTPKQNAIHPKDSLLGRRSTHSKRSNSIISPDLTTSNPSECINASICQCGIACTITCETFNSDPAPRVGDCEQLVSILKEIPSVLGDTVVVARTAPDPWIFDWGTCRTAIGNINTAGGEIEFCWDQFVNQLNAMINGCVSPGPQPGALCTATLYQTSIGPFSL